MVLVLRHADYKRWYHEVYLHSPHWRELRKRWEAKHGLHCQQCGTEEHVQLHHKTYARVGCERLEDMEALCRGHHQQRHDPRHRQSLTDPVAAVEKKTKRLFPNIHGNDVVLGYADNAKGREMRALDQERVAVGLKPLVRPEWQTRSTEHLGRKKKRKTRSYGKKTIENRRLRAHLR